MLDEAEAMDVGDGRPGAVERATQKQGILDEIQAQMQHVWDTRRSIAEADASLAALLARLESIPALVVPGGAGGAGASASGSLPGGIPDLFGEGSASGPERPVMQTDAEGRPEHLVREENGEQVVQPMRVVVQTDDDGRVSGYAGTLNTPDAPPGEKDATLVQKLGQLQPFIAVLPEECMGQLASSGPT